MPIRRFSTCSSCNVVPGFAPLGENNAAGLARIASNGIAAFSGDNLLTFANGRDVIASVMAHEIGHNFGLDHTVERRRESDESQRRSPSSSSSRKSTPSSAPPTLPNPAGKLLGDFNDDGTVTPPTTPSGAMGSAVPTPQSNTCDWKMNFGESLDGAWLAAATFGNSGATDTASAVPESPQLRSYCSPSLQSASTNVSHHDPPGPQHEWISSRLAA